MKIILRYVTLVLIGLLGFQHAEATHLIGGSLSHEYLGQNPDGTYRYRIFATTYTDCGPTSNVPEPEPFIPISIYINDLVNPNANKVMQSPLNLVLLNQQNIEPDLPSSCTVAADVCIIEGNYEAFINLPLNFGGYWLFYDRCCRNDAVVNLSPQQGVGFTTFIPSPLVVNSSPFFNAPPTPYICAGDTATFLNTAVDPDGDLLVFSFITPLRGYSSAGNPNPGNGGNPNPLPWPIPSVNYNVGFNVNQPFGAGSYAFINGSTGLTQYYAQNSGQYAIAVEIREYRDGNLIGITRRDLQILVINCPPNPAPNIAAAGSGQTIFEVNEGEQICFPVTVSDQNGDSLLLTTTGEVFDPLFVNPEATINTPLIGEGAVEADFCWFTDCSQGRENAYFFSATATDNGCPPKSANVVYTINVIPFTGSTFIEGDPSACESSTESYSTDLFANGDYVWTVSGGTITSGQGSNAIVVDWGSAGVGQISVTATNDIGCVGDPFDLEVPILPLPIIDAGDDVEICLGDTITIGGSPTGPSGSFYVWTPNTNILGPNTANPQAFPSTSGEYMVNVVSAANCSARDTIQITVNEANLTVSADQGICSGTSVQLNANGGIAYDWSPATSLDDNTLADPTASPLTSTNYVVEMTDANGCEATDSVFVEVFEVPLADAGTDSTLCGLTLDLFGIPSVGTGEWTFPAGIQVDDITDPNTTATALLPGVYLLTWTETNGAICQDADQVEITFIAEPIAFAGVDQTVCGLETTGEALLSVGTGEWSLPAGISVSDISSSVATIIASDYGDYTLTWTETNSLCSDVDQVTISFIEVPLSNAGSDDLLCGDSYTLSAIPSVGEGTWTGPAGVTFSDVNDPAATVSTTIYGPLTFTWTEDNGNTCEDASQVVITFNEIPIPDAGLDDTACGLVYELSAIPSVGDGTWTLPAGISVNDTGLPNASLTALDYGSYTLTWTEDNFNCVASEEVTINFVEIPVADAGSDDEICGSSYSLNANPSLGAGTWSGSADVTFSDVNDPNATLTLNGSSGNQVVTWTEDNGNGCTDAESITIEFKAFPEISAGVDQEVCGLFIDLEGSMDAGSGSWNSPVGYTLSDPNSSMSSITADAPGDVTMTWTVDLDGCVSTDDVELSFLATPSPDAGADEEICLFASTVLNATGGDNYTWFPVDGLNNSNVPNPTASPDTTTTYLVTVSLENGCEGTDEITIIVNDLPEVDAGEDLGYLCAGDSIQLQATPGLLSYSWSPVTGLSDPNIADPYAAPNTAQIITYTVTVTDNDGCMNSDEVQITVNPIVPTYAGNDTTICHGDPVILGGNPTSPGNSTFSWFPNLAIDDTSSANPTVFPEVSTTYVVTSANSICSGQSTVVVTVETIPSLPILISATPSCDGLKVRFINGGDEELNYLWDLGDGTASDDFSPYHEYGFNGAYTVVLSGTSALGCVYSTDTLVDANDFSAYFPIELVNVLTPNGDGVNDVLDTGLRGEIENCVEMEVFNRWGEVMFRSSGSNTLWDGRTPGGELVSAGVYFYYISLNGSKYKGSVHVSY